jgi:hypothetical protein
MPEYLDYIFTCMLFILWWWNFCMDSQHNMMLLLFLNNYYIQLWHGKMYIFCRWFGIFLCVVLNRQNNGNFSVSTPSFSDRSTPTEKTNFSVGVDFFSVRNNTRKIVFWFGGNHFFCECLPHGNMFFWRWTHGKIQIFCHPISVGIFLSVTVRKTFFRGYTHFSVGFCTHGKIRVSSSVSFYNCFNIHRIW